MGHPVETRFSLIVRLKDSRDEAAWAEFLLLYEPMILRLARNNRLNDADARDVCQQVLAAIVSDVEKWKPDGKPASFRRWLNRVARNRIFKFLAKERGMPVAEGGTDAVEKLQIQPDQRESLSAEIEKQYRQQLLLTGGELIRAEFHDSTWQAFWMTCIAGRSVADAATELQTSVGNVYVSRSRIIARLREKVRELQGDD